jgi:hypothetical protein
MSATHTRFGEVGRNWRSTRSVAGVMPAVRTVVFQRFRGRTPEIPAASSTGRRACARPGCCAPSAARRGSAAPVHAAAGVAGRAGPRRSRFSLPLRVRPHCRGAGGRAACGPHPLVRLLAPLQERTRPGRPASSPGRRALRAARRVARGGAARLEGPDGAHMAHHGGTGGFRSFAAVVPEARVAVVVLSDQERAVGRLGLRLLAARVKPPGAPARRMPA